VAEVHDAVPLRLAQGENLARAPVLGGKAPRRRSRSASGWRGTVEIISEGHWKLFTRL
jgi:hypothetical protein